MVHKIISTCLIYLIIGLFTILYTFRFLYRLYKNRGKPIQQLDLSVEPKCLSDPKLGKHGSIRLKNRNIEIHYVAKGDPSKPLMLFVHGFPEFWYSWRHQLTEFGDDYYAVAMDMTGYGGSSKPSEVARYNTLELTEDIKEFVLEMGYKSCVLVAHDWGGVLAYVVANNFPDVVDKLIIMNAPHKRALNKAKSFKQFLKSSYIFFFQTPYLPDYTMSRNNCESLDMLKKGPMKCKNTETFTDEDLIAYKYTFMKGGFTGPLNYYRNTLFTSYRQKGERIPFQIHVPSLIIWGTDDAALGKELAAACAESIDDCIVKYVEGASHWVNQECPIEVNKIMREYLA